MSTVTESNLLPISALQHFVFCQRQFALIHIEQIWADNALTMKGRQLHKNAHESGIKMIGRDMKIASGMPLRSLQLGITGVSDIVEFFKNGDDWIPFPIEYKHGNQNHTVQMRYSCAPKPYVLKK